LFIYLLPFWILLAIYPLYIYIVVSNASMIASIFIGSIFKCNNGAGDVSAMALIALIIKIILVSHGQIAGDLTKVAFKYRTNDEPDDIQNSVLIKIR